MPSENTYLNTSAAFDKDDVKNKNSSWLFIWKYLFPLSYRFQVLYSFLSYASLISEDTAERGPGYLSANFSMNNS